MSLQSLPISSLRSLSRAYVRYAPWSLGKETLYRQFIKTRIAWRPGQSMARTVHGTRHRIRFPDSIQTRLYYFGIWEPAVTQVFLDVLKPGDVVIDIGANVGYYTLLSSACVGRKGEVWAIEASPSIFRELQEAVALNNAANVRAANVAVHKEHARVRFYKADAGNIGRSTMMEDGHEGMELEAEVEARPLGSIVPLEKLLRARLIKIDVEGAEWLVFEGIRPLLNQFSPETCWLMELAPQRMEPGQCEAIFEAFTKLGYHGYRIQNTYLDDEYLRPHRQTHEILDRAPVTQSDVLFMRSAEGAPL
jgi:FkbM family methyltransferase